LTIKGKNVNATHPSHTKVKEKLRGQLKPGKTKQSMVILIFPLLTSSKKGWTGQNIESGWL